jgi:hypothetical protein
MGRLYRTVALLKNVAVWEKAEGIRENLGALQAAFFSSLVEP